MISPFNFPLILAIRSVAPALALGNAVVLKPDPRTAVTGGVVLARIFEEAGLPDGLLHVLPGGADVGRGAGHRPAGAGHLVHRLDRGRPRVGELAGRHLKRAHLELGGNSALIVLDDADVDQAASAGAWGSFLHQGQICMTTGRHLVARAGLRRVRGARWPRKADAPAGRRPGHRQVALGPLIDERPARQDPRRSSPRASTPGARLAAGGTVRRAVLPAHRARRRRRRHARLRGGDLRPGRAGAPVLRPRTRRVALAADTEYGLSLGILTRDVMRGLALADRIPTGIVHINDQTVDDEAERPVRRRRRLRHRAALRRRRQPRGVHRDPLGHRPGRYRALPLLGLGRRETHAPVRADVVRSSQNGGYVLPPPLQQRRHGLDLGVASRASWPISRPQPDCL